MNDTTTYQLHSVDKYIYSSLQREDYNKLLQARKMILFGLSFEQKLDMLLENYLELEKSIVNFALQKLVFSANPSTYHREGRHIINRHLCNFLSSAKLYSDYIKHALSDHFGTESECYKCYLSEIGKHQLIYGRFSMIRNYTTHYDVPAHSIKFSSVVEKTETNDSTGSKIQERNRHVITFALDIDKMMEDPNVSNNQRETLKSLSNHEEKVDLIPLIRDIVSSIVQLHLSVRNCIASELMEADKYAENLLKSISSSNQQDSSAGLIREMNGETPVASEDICLEWVEERRAYEEKNSRIYNFMYHYVASQ